MKRLDQDLTRRKFMKIVGGATGFAALSISGVGSLLDFDLGAKKLSIDDIDVRSSDPENPDQGDVWLREDVE